MRAHDRSEQIAEEYLAQLTAGHGQLDETEPTGSVLDYWFVDYIAGALVMAVSVALISPYLRALLI